MATADTMPLSAGAPRHPVALWRWVLAALSVACMVAVAQLPRNERSIAWDLLAAALVLATVWNLRLRIVRPVPNVARGWR